MTDPLPHLFIHDDKRRIELVGQTFKEERPIRRVSLINNEYEEISFIWQKHKAGTVKEKVRLF